MQRSRAAGFTLIEVLIALAIMAVIGLIANQLLTSTLAARERFDLRADALKALQRASMRIDRDLRQVVARPIRDGYGDVRAALLLEDGILEFSRTGWRNPRGERRPTLQRVAYELDRGNGRLQRSSWPVMDRAVDSQAMAYPLLEDVSELDIRIIDTEGATHGRWPESADTDADDGLVPAGIELTFEVEPFGPIRRVYSVAWYNADAQAREPGEACDPVVDPDCEAQGGGGEDDVIGPGGSTPPVTGRGRPPVTPPAGQPRGNPRDIRR